MASKHQTTVSNQPAIGDKSEIGNKISSESDYWTLIQQKLSAIDEHIDQMQENYEKLDVKFDNIITKVDSLKTDVKSKIDKIIKWLRTLTIVSIVFASFLFFGLYIILGPYITISCCSSSRTHASAAGRSNGQATVPIPAVSGYFAACSCFS